MVLQIYEPGLQLRSHSGQPIFYLLRFPNWMKVRLKSHVKAFILNKHGYIPEALQLAFPNLLNIVKKVSIPMEVSEDERI